MKDKITDERLEEIANWTAHEKIKDPSIQQMIMTLMMSEMKRIAIELIEWRKRDDYGKDI